MILIYFNMIIFIVYCYMIDQDLKIENVIRGADGFWKLCDFGSWTDEHKDLTNASRREMGQLEEHYAV